ncbi:MAG: PRC-barrel domain-containing protein [Chloroflexi bacterium]|nr:PRC-barrel domain-containing protein [Chloroflexota bacterium]MCI0576445.1 PRC-barrel domain-containing protein [Chloroflexota bacterium]MCI0648897.1 PRC-barrel domain-containing protein [Chloroflexota bacterium]MCI0725839.1 PRC-barrel domain-containing protein [Chloroflexota bacterium]
MRVGKELIGKPVISVTDGRLLGHVKDLYLDQDLELINGIFLGQEGLFNRKALLVPRREVTVFGLDAVLVRASDVVTDDSEVEEIKHWLRREELQGREVDTPGRTKVGTVGDILFNDQAQIVGFSLAKVFVEGPVAKSRTVMKGAITDTGRDDGIMTVDLAKAEQSGSEPEK